MSVTRSSRQMKSRYAETFKQLKQAGRTAFIPFTLLGWPSSQMSLQMIRTMIEQGATALELGIPFSDPVADGPVIQEAATEALASGFRVDDAMAQLREVRAMDPGIPIGLLVYYNLILARGTERFFRELGESGVDGVLIPDLPPESAHEVLPYAEKAGVELIFIVSPLTSQERLRRISEVAGGFLYVVSRLGVTGVEERYDEELESLLTRIRQCSSLPACVGFGISTPEHACQMKSLGADGVIVGSRIIQIIQSERQKGDALETAHPQLSGYLSEMGQAAG